MGRLVGVLPPAGDRPTTDVAPCSVNDRIDDVRDQLSSALALVERHVAEQALKEADHAHR